MGTNPQKRNKYTAKTTKRNYNHFHKIRQYFMRKPTKDDLFQFNNSYEITNAPFSDVNLIVFARSQSSWHSVEYPANLALGTRMSININFEISNQDRNRRARGL